MRDRYTALHSTTYTLNISSYEIDIQLCIRKQSFKISSCGLIFSSKFNNIYTLIIELCFEVQHCIRKHSSSKLSCRIDIFLCIRKHSPGISTCVIKIQHYIQQHPYFEYRAIGSKFSFPFENIRFQYRLMRSIFQHNTHSENRAVELTFSSEFETTHPECRAVRSIFSSTYNNKKHSKYRSMGSTFSSVFEKINLIIQLWGRISALHSSQYTFLISSYRIGFQICI